MMDLEWLRKECLSLPHTTEHVVWEDHLVFKLGGKMYALTSFEPPGAWLALKCTDDDFAELVERPDIIPSPYLARAKWISVKTNRALVPNEVKRLLRQSYDLVWAKLPKKTRASLEKSRARERSPGMKNHRGTEARRKVAS
jgi:predicted DNA-binding protein (MmcQ/YjbR family)